ncbi:type II secretion system F family protein [Patescibacteria group bacterium]
MEFEGLSIETPKKDKDKKEGEKEESQVAQPPAAPPPSPETPEMASKEVPEALKEESSKEEASKEEAFQIEGAKKPDEKSSKDILSKIKSFRSQQAETVVYGVYDNAEQSLFSRINNFFIDHSKITVKDKAYFFHMLAVMVDAGIPIVQAVKSISGRVENRHFQRVLNTVGYNAERGLNLTDAMSRFDDVFDESEMGIIKSGEATGRLHIMLFKLAERLDKRNELNSKLWGAAIYPIAVLGILVLVAVGMLVWVFPTLLGLLTEGGMQPEDLPGPTRFLLVIQNSLVSYWWLMILGCLSIYGIFQLYVSTEYGLVRWHYTTLRIPIVGNLIRKVYVLRFVDMLGLLIDAGVPVIQSLNITGNSLKNRVYRLKTREVMDTVSEGGKISTSMSDSEFLFPPEVIQMISVGESSASLGPIAAKVSEQYDREIDGAIKKLTSVFEPVMILFVGLFVALLALAIMAPIFNLGSVVGG